MSYTTYLGDCLEVMKDLSANSIDCFICDLPYGCLSQKVAETTNCEWDVAIDLNKFWEQVKRLAKDSHTPVIHFCSARFGHELIKSNEKWFRYDLIWEKTNAVGFLTANKMPLRAHESMYVFSKAGANYKRIDISGNFPESGGGRSKSSYITQVNTMPNFCTKTEAGRRCVKSVIKVSNPKVKDGHPTQKPEELYRWLIERYCPVGGTILDPTAGSFRSCKVAVALGRNAIGIEKDKKFYDRFSKRE